MLAKEHSNLDAVCVGTPDHMHAPMAMSAMRLGLPVYQQKPMAHSVHEVHMLTAMARKKNLVTQMGIQIHSAREYKTAVAVDPERRHRQDQGSAFLQREEVGRFRSAARAHRPRPFHAQLGSLDRCGATASLHPRCLSSGELAQADRFRHRHLRRHGLPHPGPGIRRAGTGRAASPCAPKAPRRTGRVGRSIR